MAGPQDQRIGEQLLDEGLGVLEAAVRALGGGATVRGWRPRFAPAHS